MKNCRYNTSGECPVNDESNCEYLKVCRAAIVGQKRKPIFGALWITIIALLIIVGILLWHALTYSGPEPVIWP